MWRKNRNSGFREFLSGNFFGEKVNLRFVANKKSFQKLSPSLFQLLCFDHLVSKSDYKMATKSTVTLNYVSPHGSPSRSQIV